MTRVSTERGAGSSTETSSGRTIRDLLHAIAADLAGKGELHHVAGGDVLEDAEEAIAVARDPDVPHLARARGAGDVARAAVERPLVGAVQHRYLEAQAWDAQDRQRWGTWSGDGRRVGPDPPAVPEALVDLRRGRPHRSAKYLLPQATAIRRPLRDLERMERALRGEERQPPRAAPDSGQDQAHHPRRALGAEEPRAHRRALEGAAGFHSGCTTISSCCTQANLRSGQRARFPRHWTWNRA